MLILERDGSVTQPPSNDHRTNVGRSRSTAQKYARTPERPSIFTRLLRVARGMFGQAEEHEDDSYDQR